VTVAIIAAMPRVQLHLYAALRSYLGGKPSVEVEIKPDQTVSDVLEQLGIPSGEARIIFVNNRSAELFQPLSGGEHIGVFPAIGGG